MATKEQHLIADKVLEFLSEKKDWRVEDYVSGETYCLIHDKAKLALWMCSGFWFLKLKQPTEVKFPFFKALKIWRIARPLFLRLSLIGLEKGEERRKKELDETLKTLNKKK